MAISRMPSRRAGFTSTLALTILALWCSAAAAAQLTLSWNDAGNNESGFSVERSLGASGQFSEIGATGAGVTSYTDSTVAGGTAYCYRVAAYNGAGYSGYTNVACATAAQMFGLAVVKMGSGGGTVTGSPAGITCGSSCSGNYPGGSVVSLTAVASSGSTFSGWSGGNCSGSGSCSVTLSGPTTVTATFALQTATLTTSKSGAGSGTITSAPAGIQCGGTCSGEFPKGAVVSLTASPASGSTFSGWTGGGCSGTGACSVTMNTATSVTAAFGVAPVSLTLAKSGSGSGLVTSSPSGISCGAVCTGNYPTGASVTLAAVPSAGSVFSGWSGGGCSGTGGCSLTLTAATTVTAAFAVPPGPPADTSPPVVSFVSPSGGSSVSGVATLVVSASDDRGVTALSYFLDGNPLGTVSPPLPSFTWDSTTTANGPHTLSVKAFDAAGNAAQSSVSIVVDNSTPTAMAVDAPPVTYGANAIVTVSVSSASGTPDGEVSLTVDGGSPRSVVLANGRAQFTVSAPNVGDHPLKATFARQGGYGASAATGMLSVTGAPPAATLFSFSRDAYSGRPVRSSVAVTVVRSGSTRTYATVQYETSDGSATAGVHYRATSGTLRFKPGVTKRTFYVQVLGSTITTPRTVNLLLSDPSSGAGLVEPSTAVLTLDNTR